MNFFIDKNNLKKSNYFILLPYNKEIVPVEFKLKINFDDILFVDRQKELILNNTRKFIQNDTSNNVLLWGASEWGNLL